MGKLLCHQLTYWTNCKTREEIASRVKEANIEILRYSKSPGLMKHQVTSLALMCLFIRDYREGLGYKDISRWMILELDRVFPSFASSIVPSLPVFGYWKDLNLILIDVYGDLHYEPLVERIYEYLSNRYYKDLNYYKIGEENRISLLVKYIGKERRSLDRKTGFTRKFVARNYPETYELSPARALSDFRSDCKLLMDVVRNRHLNQIPITRNSKLPYNYDNWTSVKDWAYYSTALKKFSGSFVLNQAGSEMLKSVSSLICFSDSESDGTDHSSVSQEVLYPSEHELPSSSTFDFLDDEEDSVTPIDVDQFRKSIFENDFVNELWENPLKDTTSQGKFPDYGSFTKVHADVNQEPLSNTDYDDLENGEFRPFTDITNAYPAQSTPRHDNLQSSVDTCFQPFNETEFSNTFATQKPTSALDFFSTPPSSDNESSNTLSVIKPPVFNFPDPPTTPAFNFPDPPTTPVFNFPDPPTTSTFSFTNTTSPTPAFTFNEKSVPSLPDPNGYFFDKNFKFDWKLPTSNSNANNQVEFTPTKASFSDLVKPSDVVHTFGSTFTPTKEMNNKPLVVKPIYNTPLFEPLTVIPENKLPKSEAIKVHDIPYLDLSLDAQPRVNNYYPGCLLDPSKSYWENPQTSSPKITCLSSFNYNDEAHECKPCDKNSVIDNWKELEPKKPWENCKDIEPKVFNIISKKPPVEKINNWCTTTNPSQLTVKVHSENPYTREVYYDKTRPDLISKSNNEIEINYENEKNLDYWKTDISSTTDTTCKKFKFEIPDQLMEIECPDCGELMYVSKNDEDKLCGLCKIEYTLQIQHWYRVSKLRKLAYSTLREVDNRITKKKNAEKIIRRTVQNYIEKEKKRILDEGDFVLVDADDF
jgi:DNA-directed RNA polymerase subunit M/transcription elongation factor TFIIS